MKCTKLCVGRVKAAFWCYRKCYSPFAEYGVRSTGSLKLQYKATLKISGKAMRQIPTPIYFPLIIHNTMSCMSFLDHRNWERQE